MELPLRVEPLDEGDHFVRKPRDVPDGMVGGGCFVGDSFAINTKFKPRCLGPGRSEVGAAVFLRSADNCWSDAVGALRPRFGSGPAVRSHEWKQRGSNHL